MTFVKRSISTIYIGSMYLNKDGFFFFFHISSELNRVLPSPIQDLSKYVTYDFREEVNKHDIYRIYVS